MPRTRSKGGAGGPASAATSTTSATSRYQLADEVDEPSRLLILPTSASAEGRIVSLPNPRYSKPTRYLVCPKTGFYEFTNVAAPKSTPRSWLVDSAEVSRREVRTSSQCGDDAKFQAQVIKEADLFVATAIDPLFLVLPALLAQSSSRSSDPPKRMFLSSDDHFDLMSSASSNLPDILKWEATRTLLESRMSAVCDTVEAGDELMFRLNEKKVLGEILAKARRMTEQPLPRSMEEKFVKKALEAPVMSVRRDPSKSAQGASGDGTEADANVATPLTDSTESQASVSSIDTAASFASVASTAATSISDEPMQAISDEVMTTAMQASDKVTQLQRLKVAFNFICSSYIPPSFAEQLKTMLAARETCSIDFSLLDDYLSKLAKLRQDALSARSTADYSRKRGFDEENEERAEKRRKMEEEEKRRKAGESRGVRDLKKVNVSGMKKLSEFFKKK